MRRPLLVQAVLLIAAALLAMPGGPEVRAPGAPRAPADDDSALRAFYAGNGFLNRGMHDLAAAEYREFLAASADHPQAAVARYGLGACLFNLGQYDEAITQLEQVRDRSDFEYAAVARLILGQCHLMRGDYGPAVESFAVVLAEHADHDLADEAAALQAEALYYAGDHADVEAPCQLLVTRWPDSPMRERAEFFWGLSEIARGNDARAAARLRAVSERYPGGEYAEQTALLLAQCLHRSNAMDEAKTAYEAILAGADGASTPDAIYGLALLLHQRGEMKESGALLDRLTERFPDNDLITSATFLRGRVYFDEGDYDKAAKRFAGVAKKIGDQQDDAAYWLAKCDLRNGDPAAAHRRLAAAIEQFPKSDVLAEMVYDGAVAHMRMDDVAAAAAALQDFPRTFDGHPLVPDALHLLAGAEHRRGRYAESQALCARFNERFPDHELAADIAFLAAENDYLLERYEPAALAFESFLTRFPDRARATDARYRLGMSLYHLDRADAARPVLERITSEQGAEVSFALAWFALGDIHFRNGTWDSAAAHLDRYLDVDPEATAADDALIKLGLARMRRGEHDAALAAFDALLARDAESPHRLHAQFERGQTLLALERPDDAAASFTSIVEAGPESRFAPFAWRHLGSLAQSDGRLVEAAAEFARAAAAAPDDAAFAADALYQSGHALLAAGELEAATATFDRVVNEFPAWERRPDAAALGAVALARQGRPEPALERITATERDHLAALDDELVALLLYERAWCERELDRPAEAETTYERLLDVSGDGDLYLHGMLELAELEAAAERYEEAASRLRTLRTQLEAAPGSPPVGSPPVPEELRKQAAYRLGVCEYRLDRFDASSELFESFLASFPDSDLEASAQLLCGESHFKTGRHDKAADHLRRVVERHPADEGYGPALLRLGECLAVLQDWPASEKAYRRYLEGIKTSDQRYQAQFGVAWALENQDQREKAIEAYAVVVGAPRTDCGAAQFQIGECLFAMERYDEAVRNLMKVDILYAYPEWSAAALYEAGRCFQKLSDPVQARKQFESVQRDYGDTEWSRLAAQRLEELARTTLPGRGT